jgi:RNA polymerase sigma-70 factor (ECF subfamily)
LFPLIILAIENESDRAFVEEIYVQYRHLMYNTIKKMIHNDQDVEDIINEAILRLIKNISTIRELNTFSLRKYIMSTTKTTTINYLGKKKTKSQYEFIPPDNMLESIPSDDESDTEGILVQLADIQLLKDALRALPKYEYEVLFMREYDGLTDAEIAGILGKKENSVRSYASRAYRHAQELLSR